MIRDLYNGALADLDLGLSPWTMNRYGFAGGNPVSLIELDGHIGGLPDEDLRELRKAGYTYVMGRGVVPLPSGASGGGTTGLGSPGGQSHDGLQQPTHAPCGARDWAEGFHNSPLTLDFGSNCLIQLMGSLGPGMPGFSVSGILNLSGGEGGGAGGSGARDAEDQVAYESTDLSKMAALYRLVRGKLSWRELLNPNMRRNVAIFEYKTEWGTAYAAGTNEPGGKHAEQVVWEGLKRQGVRKQDVSRIYSELQPCSPQIRNCSALVGSFPNARVSWSFEYGATSASRRAGVRELEEAIRSLSTGQPRFPFLP